MHARFAVAGATAALAWAAVDPLSKRLFRTDYSDVELVGLPVHLANGAVFGLVYGRVRVNAVALAVVEGVVLWPLVRLFEREAVKSPRAFAKSASEHALFGAILGALASRV